METEVITKELQKYDTTDAAIATLRQQYMALTIKGLDDKDGFDQVHKARMNVKTKRVQVAKRGKELREDAVAFQKAVLTEEKRIIGLLEPIEDHLSDEESRVEQERSRIKAEAEAKEATRIQARVNRLFSLGCRFDGMSYSYGQLIAPQALVKSCTDEQFETFIGVIQDAINQESTKKAEEERERREEADRIKKVAEEQEKERRRLAEEAKRLNDEKDRLERDRIAAAHKIIQEEKAKAREEELRIAREEAAEKARLAEQERIRIQAEEKARKEEAARIRAERKAARRPDKEKLIAYVDSIMSIPAPELKTEDGNVAWQEISQKLEDCNASLIAVIGQL